MKDRLFSYCFLCAIFLFVATGLSSCTSDSQTEDGYNNIKQSFENMKGSYEGRAVMSDNSNRLTIRISRERQKVSVTRRRSTVSVCPACRH